MKRFALSLLRLHAMRCIAIVVGMSSHLVASDEAVEAMLPELAGITRIKECVMVCAVLDGESRWLSAVGETIGPFKLIGIDPESDYVDFERDGATSRVWLRDAAVKDAGRQEAPGRSRGSLDAISTKDFDGEEYKTRGGQRLAYDRDSEASFS